MKNRLLLFLIATTFLSCETTFSKLNSYNDGLSVLKGSRDYQLVMRSFLQQRDSIKNRDGFYVYHPDYIRSTITDESLFFNPKHDKCLLLLLQKTAADLALDQIQVIQGTFKDDKWVFKCDRLPEIPDILCSVKKPLQDGRRVNNSNRKLSDAGRSFVLEAGSVALTGTGVDSKYWFGE